MRISDWSSDVCSSDLIALFDRRADFLAEVARYQHARKRRDDAGARELIFDQAQARFGLTQLRAGKAHFGAFVLGERFAIAAVELLPLPQRAGAVDAQVAVVERRVHRSRSEEHTSDLQSLMPRPYAFFCLQNNKK